MQIPIFPLNTVLFPGGVLPLRVFEARYMDMTRECMRKGAPFGVCLIREGREVGAAAVPHTIGCLANIADWDMQQLGLLQLRTLGGSRFRILSQQIAGNGLITAEVELLADEDERAWSVWQKKFGTPADNAADAARQHRFLQQRGFSNTSIRAVMRRAARQDVATG
jgi:Lon protease-like protein